MHRCDSPLGCFHERIADSTVGACKRNASRGVQHLREVSPCFATTEFRSDFHIRQFLTIPTFFWLIVFRLSLSAFRISESRPLSHIMLTSSVHIPLAVDTCVFARSYVFPIPALCQVSCDSGVTLTWYSVPYSGVPSPGPPSCHRRSLIPEDSCSAVPQSCTRIPSAPY